METTTYINDHSRTIVHIDIDCFYAQVEMIKNPDLTNVPLGIQQKNIVVTSNYIAREYGLKKCMSVVDAQKACPTLALVKGEDLHDYRQISYKVTTYLQTFSPLVERLGLDENYIDISELVQSKISIDNKNLLPIGNIFGDINEVCDCGCRERLTMGSIVAQEIRDSLKQQFQLTTCAGIAHNKLLAKLVGSTHKPNQQTILYPNSALELMCSLKSVGCIPGIGRILEEALKNENIKMVTDLQNAEFHQLKKIFGAEKAKFLQDLSLGIDRSFVKATGKPLSIGLEDSCKTITAIGEVKEKLLQLLSRLMVLISEDGRIPKAIKVTIRIFDGVRKVSRKETKQCNIMTSLFSLKDNKITLPAHSKEKLMVIVMNLFNKMVEVNRPYNITLLGLSFTKFLERMVGKSSIASFLRKDVEVQSITNIEHKTDTSVMDCSSSLNDCNTDGSESDYEPSPKKTKQFSAIFAKKRYFHQDDCPSPSKLKVADLHLGNDTVATTSDSNKNICCPPNANIDVFKELPKEIQEELWERYTREKNKEQRQQSTKPKINTLLNYFVKNY